MGRQERANRRRRLNPNPREDVGLPCEESCQRTCCWQSVHRAKGGIKNNNINASLTHACPARFLSSSLSLSKARLFPSLLLCTILSALDVLVVFSLFYIYRNYLIRFIPRAASSSSSNPSSTPPLPTSDQIQHVVGEKFSVVGIKNIWWTPRTNSFCLRAVRSTQQTHTRRH